MSKTFEENYYDDNNWGKKKQGKSSKQKRQKVKDYLRHIDGDFEEDFKEEIEELD